MMLLRDLLLLSGASRKPAYDAFAASLAHVYEPARRTLSTYTGALVRLRRASDDAESDFGYLSNNDLDVASIAAWAGGASYVVTIYDQTANADHVTQAVKVNQPLFVASAQNGHAGMLFDGATDRLQGAFTNGGALSQPFNAFTIAQLAAAAVGDGNFHLILDGDDAVNFMLTGQQGVSNFWYQNWGIILPGGASDGNVNLWSLLGNGVTSQFWINTVSEANGNAGANNPDGITIGARNNGTLPWNGYILNAIICDPSLSTADRQAMELAMNSYWAVY